MASTASTNLRFEKQAVGEQLNAWGTRLNTVIDLVEEAVVGTFSKSLTTSYTLTATNYVADEARPNTLIFTDGGLSGIPVITIPAKKKVYIVHNKGSAYAISISAGGTAASVRVGRITTVYCDGTDVYALDNTLDKIATPVAAVAMGTYKITGLGTGTSSTDAATVGQVVSLVAPYSYAAVGAQSAANSYAQQAETHAASAVTSAATATTQASNASTSATSAATSATNSSNSATTASTQATNAASSATTASTQATNAASSASTASTHATTASTQASNASSSASTASTNATTATTQASNASTSATNAATSATNASTSATNSATSATSAKHSELAAGSYFGALGAQINDLLAQLASAISGSVASFNSRTGAVTLAATDLATLNGQIVMEAQVFS